MYSFTVYQHRTTPAFRVVAGDHAKLADVHTYHVRIYQGADRQAAIDAAYSDERRTDIRAQIERFGVSTPAAPKVHAFNTGRLYTTAGQRIGWTVLASGRVAMVDIDRMIEYVLTIPEPKRNSDVLRAYDNHDGSMRGVWDPEFQAVKARLYAAARSAPHAS